MTELLAQRDVAQIVAFQQPLWDLLARSYQADLGPPPTSSTAVVKTTASSTSEAGWSGRIVFEQALADPDSLDTVPAVVSAIADWGAECEDILSVAWDAHRRITGDGLPSGSWSIQYPPLDPAWDFDFDDEDEMRRRLSRLAALCYERYD